MSDYSISELERKFSVALSYLFHPIFYPIIGLYLIFNSGTYLETMNVEGKQIIYLVVLISTIILPLLSLPFLYYRKIISNIELESRTERVLPLSFTLIFYLSGYYLLSKFPLPGFIYSYILAITTLAVVSLVITFWWKISLHTIGLGGLLALAVSLSVRFNIDLQMLIMLVILISGFVSTARLILKSHNIQQIMVGYFLGFITVLLYLLN